MLSWAVYVGNLEKYNKNILTKKIGNKQVREMVQLYKSKCIPTATYGAIRWGTVENLVVQNACVMGKPPKQQHILYGFFKDIRSVCAFPFLRN